MGRLIAGPNGPFIGTIGALIGSSRNGVPYVKGPYKYRTKNISDKEKLNRRKFAAAQAWLKPLLIFVRFGFKGYSAKSEGFIAAKSYLMKNALRVEDDEIVIDPALVKVSHGDLPMSEDAAFTQTGPAELTFTWAPSPIGSLNSLDQVMMLAYSFNYGRIPLKQVCQVPMGQFRSAGQDILPVEVEPGSVLHVYIAFIAHDRSRQSDSLYLGEITI